MTEKLTPTEEITLTTIRVLGQMVPAGRRTVSAGVITRQNWDDGRGLTYDQTFRALRGLVKKGMLTKPARGYYKEVDA